MKIKLAVSQKRYGALKAVFEASGFEIDEDADLVLSERGCFIDVLMVRDNASNERVLLPVRDIVYIEACGHDVRVHTEERAYQAYDRLYKLCATLDPDDFLRVSHSAVIAKNKVRQIAATLSMKFILTMSNGEKIDVTRNYYHIFKEHFGI